MVKTTVLVATITAIHGLPPGFTPRSDLLPMFALVVEGQNAMGADSGQPGAVVFDHALLHEYSMQDHKLAAEIMELFLVQLPAMLHALETADSETAWRFATHTLKGSAATIGALRLQDLAVELDSMPFRRDDTIRLLRLRTVMAAAADFQQAARRAYPPGA